MNSTKFIHDEENHTRGNFIITILLKKCNVYRNHDFRHFGSHTTARADKQIFYDHLKSLNLKVFGGLFSVSPINNQANVQNLIS